MAPPLNSRVRTQPAAPAPQLKPGADLSRVRLTPAEAFVLSRIDGRSSYDEICLLSSLGREETLRVLRKLEQAELILGVAPVPGVAPVTGGAPVTAEIRGGAGRGAEGKASELATTVGSLLERLDDGSPVDPAALAEGRDLPEETRRRILRLHRRMGKLAPHELLAVDAGADVATIKRAFAAASKELHPDRYYGKDLGSFRAKLAQIFAHVTQAMQTLQKGRRAKP
ncbi:MAG: hypothetical protein ABSB49_03760 [Polyangia bacterium]